MRRWLVGAGAFLLLVLGGSFGYELASRAKESEAERIERERHDRSIEELTQLLRVQATQLEALEREQRLWREARRADSVAAREAHVVRPGVVRVVRGESPPVEYTVPVEITARMTTLENRALQAERRAEAAEQALATAIEAQTAAIARAESAEALLAIERRKRPGLIHRATRVAIPFVLGVALGSR